MYEPNENKTSDVGNAQKSEDTQMQQATSIHNVMVVQSVRLCLHPCDDAGTPGGI